MNSREGKGIKPDPSMYKYGVDSTERVTQFDKLELSFEFKLNDTDSHDPFRDPIQSDVDRTIWEFEAGTGKDFQGQLTNYATEWCSRQHRTFAFTIYIFGTYARFIRWDRSAVVVSERFNYKEESQPLVDFLWRFVHLDDEGRGIDTTVRNATPAEAAIADDRLKQWKNSNTRSVIVFKIQDKDGLREFIGWGSMADAESLTGRATRAYLVWDIQNREVCFLKDTWRAATLERESDILRLLNEKGVPNVPKLICGGDIEGHTTLSHKFAGNDLEPSPGSPARMPWKCGSHKITQRVHHRFVEGFVGVHIDEFTSTYQLMHAIYDAFIGLFIDHMYIDISLTLFLRPPAHWAAYKLCGILHRDVSGRNVMMTEDGQGILNDWDFAKRVSGPDEVEIPRDHEHTVSFSHM
jgi:serine/threonine protein kinase